MAAHTLEGAAVTDVFAVVRADTGRWMGRLVAPHAGRPPRLAFPVEHSPASIPLGTALTVGLAPRHLPKPTQSRAKLTALERLGSVVAVELELDDPTMWREAMPEEDVRVNERRAWPRVATSLSTEFAVGVEMDRGALSGRRMGARLVDMSRGGLGLRFPLHCETRLCVAGLLRCTIQGPSGVQVRICTIRNRRLLSTGVRYGVAYTPAATPWPEPRYEAHWRCGDCGSEPLLADTHAFCPACGAPRDNTPSQFPEWDGVIHVDAHPFTGMGRGCLRCGCTWHETARNCGHCGTRLPLR